MLSLLCTESIVHLQQYLDLPITAVQDGADDSLIQTEIHKLKTI